jgi:hypothetical protein
MRERFNFHFVTANKLDGNDGIDIAELMGSFAKGEEGLEEEACESDSMVTPEGDDEIF